MKTQKIKIKNKFKEYPFSRKRGGSTAIVVRSPTQQVTQEGSNNIVLSSKLDNIKKELIQAFNDASPDVLRKKLLEQMEKLSGKKLTEKNHSEQQSEGQSKNKTRKIIPINTELSEFVNKLDNSIIYPDQILNIRKYLQDLINNSSMRTKHTTIFDSVQMLSLRSTVNETQKGQSSVLFNGYLRRMVAHFEKQIDEQNESEKTELKSIEKKLKIKIESADSAIKRARATPNPTTYRYASKAIADAAKQMQAALDEMNKTRGGADMRSDTTSEIDSKNESKKCIEAAIKKCEEINLTLSNLKDNEVINDSHNINLTEAISALEKGKKCLVSLDISVKHEDPVKDNLYSSGKSILDTFAKGKFSRSAATGNAEAKGKSISIKDFDDALFKLKNRAIKINEVINTSSQVDSKYLAECRELSEEILNTAFTVNTKIQSNSRAVGKFAGNVLHSMFSQSAQYSSEVHGVNTETQAGMGAASSIGDIATWRSNSKGFMTKINEFNRSIQSLKNESNSVYHAIFIILSIIKLLIQLIINYKKINNEDYESNNKSIEEIEKMIQDAKNIRDTKNTELVTHRESGQKIKPNTPSTNLASIVSQESKLQSTSKKPLSLKGQKTGFFSRDENTGVNGEPFNIYADVNNLSIMTFNIYSSGCNNFTIDKLPMVDLLLTQETSDFKNDKYPFRKFVGDTSEQVAIHAKININNPIEIKTESPGSGAAPRNGMIINHNGIKIANLHLEGGRHVDPYVLSHFEILNNYKIDLLQRIIADSPDIIAGDFNSVYHTKAKTLDEYLEGQYTYFGDIRNPKKSLEAHEKILIKKWNGDPFGLLIRAGYVYANPRNNQLITNGRGNTTIDCIWYKDKNLQLNECNIIPIMTTSDNYHKNICISDHNPVHATFTIKSNTLANGLAQPIANGVAQPRANGVAQPIANVGAQARTNVGATVAPNARPTIGAETRTNVGATVAPNARPTIGAETRTNGVATVGPTVEAETELISATRNI